MGCGASSDSAPPRVNQVHGGKTKVQVQPTSQSIAVTNGNAKKVTVQSPPLPAPKEISTGTASQQKSGVAGALRILVGYHSSYEKLTNKVVNSLNMQGYDVLKMSEQYPQDLDIREDAVQWCGAFIVMASVPFERSLPCTELLYHVQGNKKPICTIVVQPNYDPRGPVGALSSLGMKTKFPTDRDEFHATLDQVKRFFSKNYKDPGDAPKPSFEQDEYANDVMTDGRGNKNGRVVVIYHDDVGGTLDLLQAHNFGATFSNPNTVSRDEIRNAHIIVAALTDGFQKSDVCKQKFNIARATGRIIIPIIAQPHQRDGWLALGIAGKLYYDWTGHKTSESFYDSNVVKDFTQGVQAAKQEKLTDDEKEELRLNSYRKDMENSKERLLKAGGKWPPPKRPSLENTHECLRDVYERSAKKDADLPFNYIHHQLTRMTFKPPEPLFDHNGAPIERKFDLMISYQWDIQNFVREFYMDMSMHELKTWFDIWGNMRGNTYSAMSYGIECSSVIVSFVTNRYQQSANCNLEIKYAISLNKPIVFILAEKGITLEPWLEEAMKRNVVFHASSMSDMAVKVGGVALVKRIAETVRLAIKHLVSKNPPPDGLTEEMYEYYELKEDAEYELMTNKSLNTSAAPGGGSDDSAGYAICKRCGAKFVLGNPAGCKRHRSYYMGGTIIAGRWTCCQQRGQDALGCEDTTHTTQQETWTEMPGFSGCFTWK